MEFRHRLAHQHSGHGARRSHRGVVQDPSAINSCLTTASTICAITAELWETYYYDYLALMTVDHPAGTEIFVDERFVIPPAKLAITTVETPHPIARAVDDTGTDVTEVVSSSGRKISGYLRTRSISGSYPRSLRRG